MGNLNLFDRYYTGYNKRLEFENNIQQQVNELGDLLLTLRNTQQASNSALIETLERKTDVLNSDLYKFAQDLDVEFN